MCTSAGSQVEADLPDLAGSTVLYVGGRAHQIPKLRGLAERTGARFTHHDGGVDAELPGGRSHSLRMVSGRPGDHAAGRFVRSEPGQPVIRAADLEGPGTLQALRLEQDATAGELVQHLMPDERRAHGDPVEAPRRRLDVPYRHHQPLPGAIPGRRSTLAASTRCRWTVRATAFCT